MSIADQAYGAEPAALTGAAQNVVEHYGLAGVLLIFVLYVFWMQTKQDHKRQDREKEIYAHDSEVQEEMGKDLAVIKSDIKETKLGISHLCQSIDKLDADIRVTNEKMDRYIETIDRRSEAIVGQTNVLQLLVDRLGGGSVEEIPRPERRNTTIIRKKQSDSVVLTKDELAELISNNGGA